MGYRKFRNYFSPDNGECLIEPRYSEDRAKHKFILIEALSHCLVYIEGGKSKPIWHCVLAVASASIIFRRSDVLQREEGTEFC